MEDTYLMFSGMRSLALIMTYGVALLFLIPQSIQFGQRWKHTQKPNDLARSIGAAITAFFLLAGDFLYFMMVIRKLSILN